MLLPWHSILPMSLYTGIILLCLERGLTPSAASLVPPMRSTSGHPRVGWPACPALLLPAQACTLSSSSRCKAGNPAQLLKRTLGIEGLTARPPLHPTPLPLQAL